jgi:hypothetical protein
LIVVLAEGGECVEEPRVGVRLAVEDPGDDGLGAGEHRLIVVVGIGGRHWIERKGRVRVWRRSVGGARKPDLSVRPLWAHENIGLLSPY